MKAAILSSVLGLISMISFINFFGDIGIYYGFLSMTIINLIITSTIALKKWHLKTNWIGVIVGSSISSITFYFSYNNYKLSYSAIFIICSILLSSLYFVKNNPETTIKL